MVNPQLNKQPKKRIWGLLGDLQIEVIAAPRSFKFREQASWQEHSRIERKPSLQWTGDALNTLDLTFAWHIYWTDPVARLKELRAIAATRAPQALALGEGLWQGNYVITEINSTLQRTDAQGRVIQLECDVSLLEAGDAAPPKSKFEGVFRRRFG